MNELPIGRARVAPLNAAVLQQPNVQNIPQNNDLQQHKAVQVDTAAKLEAVPEDAEVPETEYTISVPEVLEHLRKRGVHKSKDTVQRWCRVGDLDCRKQGLLNRYFTTEKSLQALVTSLLPDMMADEAGAKAASRPSHLTSPSLLHEAVTTAVPSGDQGHAGADEGERRRMQEHEAENAAEQSNTQLHASASDAKVSALEATVEGLKNQLEQSKAMTEFLQQEIVSARGQRGDVVKIAEQMLGTLESIATGSRLEASKSQPAGPVRYQHVEADQDGV